MIPSPEKRRAAPVGTGSPPSVPRHTRTPRSIRGMTEIAREEGFKEIADCFATLARVQEAKADVLRRRWISPHISPPFYYARRSARCVGAYSLQPARRSVSYAIAVFRSVPPAQRHLDALATNGGEICGLGQCRSRKRGRRSVRVYGRRVLAGTGSGRQPRAAVLGVCTCEPLIAAMTA